MKPILSVIEITTLDGIRFRINFDGQIQTESQNGGLKALPKVNEVYQMTGDLINPVTSQIATHDVVSCLFKNIYGMEYQLTVRRAAKFTDSGVKYEIQSTLSEKREWVAVGQSFTYK